jgi:hypothetical protein
MKLKVRFFMKDGSTKPWTFSFVSLDQAREAAQMAAELLTDDGLVCSFTITSEDGSTERWFNLEGAWRQIN